MFLEKINAVGAAETVGLPLCSLSDLRLKRSYLVTRLFKVKTIYGEKIMVDLSRKMSAFLPGRMVKFFEKNPSDWDAMQQAVEDGNLLFIYEGTHYNKIRFSIGDEDDSDESDTSSEYVENSEDEKPPAKRPNVDFQEAQEFPDLDELPVEKDNRKSGNSKNFNKGSYNSDKLQLQKLKKHLQDSNNAGNSEKLQLEKLKKHLRDANDAGNSRELPAKKQKKF